MAKNLKVIELEKKIAYRPKENKVKLRTKLSR